MQNLNELCDFVNGGAWSDKEYSEVGIPVLKVSNIKGQEIDSQNISFIPFESKEKYSKHILHKNDLVIATVGSHPNLVNSAAGRSIRINNSGLGYLLNQNAVCLRTRDQQVLDQRYLAYIGQTEGFKNFIQQRGRGAANQMRIAIGSIKEFKPNLPPLPTQKRIASILSAYDDLIENNLKRIKLLEESLQLVYEITSNHKDVKEKLVYPEYCNFIKGSEPGSDNYTDNNVEKNTPFLRVGDLGARNSEIFVDSKLNGLKFTKKDDILVSLDGTIGIVRIGIEGAYSSGIRKVVCNNSLFKGFTYAFLKSINGQNQIKTYAKGSTILHASSAIPKLKFRIAINSDTEVLLNELNSMLVLIINLTEQNDKLKQSRDILLPRLMSGTINLES
jgi:type I restriction enzyme S subunit